MCAEDLIMLFFAQDSQNFWNIYCLKKQHVVYIELEVVLGIWQPCVTNQVFNLSKFIIVVFLLKDEIMMWKLLDK